MKKLISLALVFILILSLVINISASAEDATSPLLADELWPADTTIDHSLPYYQRFEGVEFTTFLNSGSSDLPEGMTLDENEVTKLITMVTGLVPKIVWAAGGSAFTEKQNAAITTGEIPDVMSVSLTQYKQLVKSGLLADLTDYFDQYLAPEMKAAHEYGHNLALEALKVDGRIYGIPQIYCYGDGSPLVWLRQDWLDKLGLTLPKTYADLEKIAIAFMEEDPDGDGQENTYGITVLPDYSATYGGTGNMGDLFLNIGGAAPQCWIKQDDGSIIYGSLMNGAKEALTVLNDWYNKGIIPADFATWTEDELKAALGNNKAGITVGPWWDVWGGVGNSINSNEDAYWTPVCLKATEDGTYFTQAGGPIFSLYVVNKNYDHPEYFVIAQNSLYSTMYEVPSMTTSNDFNPFRGSSSPNSVLGAASVSDTLLSGELSKEEYISAMLEAGVNGYEIAHWPPAMENVKKCLAEETPRKAGADAYCDYLGRYLAPKAMLDANPVFIATEFQGNTKSMDMYGTFLSDLEKDAYTKMIMGNTNGLSISDYFDGFVKDYLAQGGAEITAEVQAEVDAR